MIESKLHGWSHAFWTGRADRAARLRASIEIARQTSPLVHFGQDSKNRLVCEVTEILQRTNESGAITARVRFRSQVNDGYRPSREDYERRIASERIEVVSGERR